MRNISRRSYVLFIALVIVTFLFVVLFTPTNMLSEDLGQKDDETEDLEFLQKDNETENLEFRQKDNETESIKRLSKNYSDLRNNLIRVTKSLLVAKKHVRGIKTENALRKALSDIASSLDILNIKIDIVGNRKMQESVSICPETYNGSVFGYPFFEKGFEMTNCSYGKPLKNIITILLYYKNAYNEKYITDVLNGIHEYGEQISVLLAVPNTYKGNYLNKQRSHPQFFVTVYKPNMPIGKVLNDLIQRVRTQYVLIGHDITHFNEDIRLERLIREMERLNVTVTAGASRNQHGHWTLGCFQTAYKNHSLIYHEGYDESRHECVFCDFIVGPFIIRTDVMKKVVFDSNLTDSGLFEDYFLRLTEAGHENVICPDSMFFVNRTKKDNSERSWAKFGFKWSLSRLKISSELDIHFSCDKAYTCFPGKGYAVNPCCLKELANMINFLLDICEKHEMLCELQEGTLLGAVKLSKVLPWERDADITVLSANFSSLPKLKTNFVNAGYKIVIEQSAKCCSDNKTTGGVARIYSKHWFAELYGQYKMDSEDLIYKNMKPTKILFDGKWVNAPRNPALYTRNRYGHEIYAHAQHWRTMEKKRDGKNIKQIHSQSVKIPVNIIVSIGTMLMVICIFGNLSHSASRKAKGIFKGGKIKLFILDFMSRAERSIGGNIVFGSSVCL